jgi:hypothetical protein
MNVPGSVESRHAFTRRSAFGAFVSSALALRLGSPRGDEMSPIDVARCVAGLFSDPDGSRRLGRHYLATHPEEADIDTLVTLLCTPGSDRWRPNGSASFRLRLARCRTSDFIAGRVVDCDGWILARTEARACALAALI